MNLYLILIGLISVVSCALIIICINKPSSTTSLPTDGSKSPLRQEGLTQTQKSHLLLIVCVIFFLSMVTTNIKTSKFTVMLNSLMSLTEKGPSSTVIDLKHLYYGQKGNCEFGINKNKYPVLFEYLKEGKMQENFLSKLMSKNIDHQLLQKSKSKIQGQKISLPQLIVFSSSRHNLGAQISLPWMSQKLCKSGPNSQIPLLYLNLSHQINTQKQFKDLFKLDNYQTLKQSMCKLNGIQITKEIQKIGDYYIQRQTYFQPESHKKSQRQNTYLVIDNFQFISQLLIFNQNIFLANNPILQNSHQQNDQHKKSSPQFLGPKYHLFIQKLLTDLIPNCKVNVLLHTNDHKKVTKLYQYWKMFNKHSLYSSPIKFNHLDLQIFPFQVKHWHGLNKIEFYEILKSVISQSSKIKGKQDLVWKVFEKSFGKVSISSRKVISNDKQETIRVENNQEILITQMEHFFIKLNEQLNRDPTKQTVIKIKDVKLSDIRQKIAEYYNLGPAYLTIKNLYIPQKGVSIGLLKRRVSINDLMKLQKIQLLYVKQGKVYLVD